MLVYYEIFFTTFALQRSQVADELIFNNLHSPAGEFRQIITLLDII